MAHNAAGHSTLDLHLGAPKSFRNFKLPNQYFMVSTRQGSGPLLSRVCARTGGPDGSEWLEGPPCLGGGRISGWILPRAVIYHLPGPRGPCKSRGPHDRL